MSDEERAPGPLRRGLGTRRLEAFSDCVFAFAITLLVLNITVPASVGKHLLHAFAHLWPSYLAYVVSFSTIGAAWLTHNAITEYLERANAVLVRLNLLLLLVVSFVPFPTRLFTDYIGQADPERAAVTLYGVTLLIGSTLLLVLWRYAVRKRLLRPYAAEEEIRLLTKLLTRGLAAYPVLIIVGVFVPNAAVVGYLAIAIYYIIPWGL